MLGFPRIQPALCATRQSGGHCTVTAAKVALFDLTIDDTRHAVFPEVLSTALERIEVVGPMLVANPAFRKLAALALRDLFVSV